MTSREIQFVAEAVAQCYQYQNCNNQYEVSIEECLDIILDKLELNINKKLQEKIINLAEY